MPYFNISIHNWIFCFFVLLLWIKASYSNSCQPIEECSPLISALDDNSINKTIEIRCKFNRKIDPSLILWKFKMNKNERIITDMDDQNQILPPFQHEFLTLNNSYSSKPYSVSVLKIPLVNSSYFTNYTIISINSGCFQTVRINYKEKGITMNNNMAHSLCYYSSSMFMLLILSISSIALY